MVEQVGEVDAVAPNVDVTLIVCGAPLASRTPDLVKVLVEEGWRPTVVGTHASAAWMDVDAVAAVVGEPPQFEFRRPGQAKRGGTPAAVVVCPATFNTVNKVVAGFSDTYALAVLCEAVGNGSPVVMVPMANDRLWGHPAWSTSLAILAGAGVTLLDVRSGKRGASAVPSGAGGDVVAGFDPRWVVTSLAARSSGLRGVDGG